jgi:hypothetical protein
LLYHQHWVQFLGFLFFYIFLSLNSTHFLRFFNSLRPFILLELSMMEQHQKQQPIKKFVILEIREVSISKNTRLIKVNSHVEEKSLVVLQKERLLVLLWWCKQRMKKIIDSCISIVPRSFYAIIGEFTNHKQLRVEICLCEFFYT